MESAPHTKPDNHAQAGKGVFMSKDKANFKRAKRMYSGQEEPSFFILHSLAKECGKTYKSRIEKLMNKIFCRNVKNG